MGSQVGRYFLIILLAFSSNQSYSHNKIAIWPLLEETISSPALEQFVQTCQTTIVPNFEKLLSAYDCSRNLIELEPYKNDVRDPATANKSSLQPIELAAFETSTKEQDTKTATKNQQGNFDSLLSDILATIIGGMILAVIFFATRERIFPLPSITGQWYLEQRTITSAYNPYKGMILRYVAILIREGNRIEGTGELVYEDSSTGKRHYYGKNRRRSTITGYIEKNYFSKDKVQLHVVEDGHGRVSSHFYELTVIKNKPMEGKFSSMVADSTGVAKCQRTPY